MSRRALLALLGLMLALALLPAGGARASDESAERAWNSENAAFDANAREFRRAARRWKPSRPSTARPLLRAMSRYDRLIALVTRRVRRAEPTTSTGAQARRRALLALRHLRSSNRLLRATTVAVNAGRTSRARRLLKRARRAESAGNRHLARANALFRQARREREAAGQTPTTPPPSQPPPSSSPPPSDPPPPSSSPPPSDPPPEDPPPSQPPPEEDPGEGGPSGGLPDLPIPLPVLG